MEIFEQKGELIFLEIAGRPPGALVNKIHAYNHGINLMDWDVNIETDLDIPLKTVETKPAFWTCFPFGQGRVKSVNSPDIKGNFVIDWNISSGELLQKSGEYC